MSATNYVNTLLNIPIMTAAAMTAARPFPLTEEYKARPVQDITGAHARPNGISITHARRRHVADIARGGVTVAYRPVNNYRNCRMVEVAVAYCSPSDTFSKRVGSALAVEKFLNGETIQVPARDPQNPDDLPHALRAIFGMML